jgi:hypothetical protein
MRLSPFRFRFFFAYLTGGVLNRAAGTHTAAGPAFNADIFLDSVTFFSFTLNRFCGAYFFAYAAPDTIIGNIKGHCLLSILYLR